MADTELQAAEEKTPRLAQRVITEQNAYIMRTLMRDVVRYGTGRRALRTGRRDLAGKTGTTNDQKDAWFSGYSSTLVTSAWVGFDMNKPLGSRETGARAALPMWVDFMGHAMKGVPEVPYEQPAGLVTVRIDPETGMLADNSQQDAIFEIFREANVPQQRNVSAVAPGSAGNTPDGDGITEQLF
jgi:penicillin-binding protein 1A